MSQDAPQSQAAAPGGWFLPRVHIFSQYAGQAQPLETLELLIAHQMLLPRHLVYLEGRRVAEAIQFPELRRFFARHIPNLGEIVNERVFLPSDIREELYELARQMGSVEPIPEPDTKSIDELAPWRLPSLPELYGLRGMRVSLKTMDRVIREGRLAPNQLVGFQDGPLRQAGSFPQLQAVFRETYPDFNQGHYRTATVSGIYILPFFRDENMRWGMLKGVILGLSFAVAWGVPSVWLAGWPLESLLRWSAHLFGVGLLGGVIGATLHWRKTFLISAATPFVTALSRGALAGLGIGLALGFVEGLAVLGWLSLLGGGEDWFSTISMPLFNGLVAGGVVGAGWTAWEHFSELRPD